MNITSAERAVFKQAFLDNSLPIQALKENGLDLVKFNKKFGEYIIVDNTNKLPVYILTNKGKKLVESWGVRQVEDLTTYATQAQNVLNADPLLYYVKSFDKIHKGEIPLKILQLVSALSASCATVCIHDFSCGPSGSGKSAIKRKTGVYYLPKNMYVRYSSASAKSLVYTAREEGSDYYKNKVIFFDEADASQEAVPLLRDLTDAESERVVHNTVENQKRLLLILDKPVVVWFSSVTPIEDDQLKNRVIMSNPDDSSELDDAVHEWQKQLLHMGENLFFEPEGAAVVRTMISQVINDTKNLKVLIPFDVTWNLTFNRRIYPYFASLIQIITKIYYKHRMIKDGYILATYSDFKLAVEVWKKIVETTLGQVPQQAIDLLKLLPDTKEEGVSYAELASNEECQLSTYKVRRLCRLLDIQGLISNDKEKNRYFLWKSPKAKIFINTETVIDSTDEYAKEFLKRTVFKEDITDALENIQQEPMNILENLDVVSFGETKRKTFTEKDVLTWSDKKEHVLNYFENREEVDFDNLQASYVRKFHSSADLNIILNKLKEEQIVFEPRPNMLKKL